jgi:hypothetical protein
VLVLKESSRDRWLLGLVVLMSVAANLPENMTQYFAIDKKWLLVGLLVIVAVSLVRYLRTGLIMVTAVLVLGANLPAELAEYFNLDPTVMLYTLGIMIAIPLANRYFKLPTGLEPKQVAKTAYGAKALFHAVLKGNVPVVQSLIDSSVNVNVRTGSGKTPLMASAFRGYTDIAQLLISAGADIHSMDRDGNTALTVAQNHGFSRIVALLKIANEKEREKAKDATIDVRTMGGSAKIAASG